MGEIVDLDRYRKHRRRPSGPSDKAGRTRGRGRVAPKGEDPRAAVEPIDRDRAKPDPTTEIDRDDKTAD